MTKFILGSYEMTDVQLFMNIYDIKPHEPLWERIIDKHDPPEDWDKVDLINDIRKHGMKYQLNVDPDGNIRNGNARYWIARQLLEEENDQRFLYLPVQRSYAAGMYNHMFKAEIDNSLIQPVLGESQAETNKRNREMCEKVIDQLTVGMFKEFMNIKDTIIPCADKFEHYEIDPENEVFLKRHWDQSSGEYTSFVIQHPKEQKYVFALILEGHRSFKELLQDERLKGFAQESRNKYNDGKQEFQRGQMMARIRRRRK